MPLYALALFVVLMGYDSLGVGGGAPEAWAWGVSIGLKVLVGLAWWRVCRGVCLRWSQPGLQGALKRMFRFADVYGGLAVVLFAGDLWMGLLSGLRGWLGDLVLVDELLVLMPTLALLAWRWVPYHAVDGWLREAALGRRLMEGKPVYPTPSIERYVLDQVRHQLGPVLLPVLLILGWLEVLNLMRVESVEGMALLVGGVVVIMALAAPMIVMMWRTRRVPEGELREDLVALCRDARVRAGSFRLWITEGSMANAAVLGIVWPFRYLLISDTILDHLRKEEVVGVLAHEVAHVRERHAVWLGAGTLVIAVVGETLVRVSPWGERLNAIAGMAELGAWEVGVLFGATAAVMVLWWLGTGYLSRRFERQADAAGAKALSRRLDPGAVVVNGEASVVMAAALDQVAALNGMSTTRFMWRHGSIRERQVHLRSLAGQPMDGLAIDRTVNWLRVAIVVVGVGLGVVWWGMGV
ncbi:MAG: M48 family metalloprotease [Phycisphaeraceae bacterium]